MNSAREYVCELLNLKRGDLTFSESFFIMNKQSQKILQEVFGYSKFRGEQEAIIDQLCSGGDALVLMPTGGGKSLCYQIPALLRSGVGVIVSPLIALMKNQVDRLSQMGVKAAYLNSSLDYLDFQYTQDQLLQGKLDLIYVAPERLVTEDFLNLLSKIPLALFAIDEAHCVSQWGHDFRKEYLQLSVLHERFPKVPRIALTATADSNTRREIIERLQLESAQVFVNSFDRPNIHYQIVLKENTKVQLLEFIRGEEQGVSGIVYCLSRKKTEDTAQWLNEQGLRALPYHAGLSSELRQKNQDIFLKEEGVIIVATIAFGMGIDKPDVRFVAHLDLPKSLESYFQETGRAGRDGLPAKAWMAYSLGDVVQLRQMVERSEANENRKRLEMQKLNFLLGFCESTLCRRQILLNYFDEEFPGNCQRCDNCLNPTETWDATIAAQKALSCVYRTEERFGVLYLIDVLMGKTTPQMERFGHQNLSTFGIGKELDKKKWSSVFRQLVAGGYLTADLEGYGSLKLTGNARAVLKGELYLQFRKDPPKKIKKRDLALSVRASSSDEKVDPALWEALRECRRALAQKQGVPPFMIFHDSTLREMAQFKPKDSSALLQISGVGAHKLKNYGETFLKIIAEMAK